MNKKKRLVIVIIIFVFAISAIFAVILQTPNQNKIKIASEQSTNKTGNDLIGAKNIKSFADIYNNTKNKTLFNKTVAPRPTVTPKPPPYPRITINYTFQKTDSIRGINVGPNSSFIILSLDIRNYGYKYFDADPNKFRLGSLKPILNVSTGNMLNEVIPNNSEVQGDLIFLTENKNRWTTKLSYNEGYTIIYNFGINGNFGNNFGIGGIGIQVGPRRNINVINNYSE